MNSWQNRISRYFRLGSAQSAYWHRIRATIVSTFLVIAGNMLFGLLHFLTEPGIYGGLYSYFAAAVNIIPLIFIYYRRYYVAKLILSLLFIINTFLFTYVLYSPALWNYLFFILVPPFCNMIFEIKERITKWVLSLFATGLMLFCVFFPSDFHLIDISSFDEILTNAGILLSIMVVISASIAVILSDLEQSEAQLLLLTQTDPLTGLYNRIAFDQRLHAFHAERAGMHGVYSIIFIDVNKFKSINDLYGHMVGDKVLVAIAKVLRHNTRDQDMVIRFGGDEFIMFLPHAPSSEAGIIAQRISDKVAKNVSERCGFKVSVSMGISEGLLNRGKDNIIEQSIIRADKALYQAKRRKEALFIAK